MPVLAKLQSRRAGLSMTWLSGGALGLNVILVVGLIAVLGYHGLGYFWPQSLVQVTTKDGTVYLGELWNREEIPDAEPNADGSPATRIRMKVGNRDLGDRQDFVWLDEPDITRWEAPADAVVLERREYGNFYGYLREFQQGDTRLEDAAAIQAALEQDMQTLDGVRDEIQHVEEVVIGDINREIEAVRLRLRALTEGDPQAAERPDVKRLLAEQAEREALYEEKAALLFEMRDRLEHDKVQVADARGNTKEVMVGDLVRVLRPNRMGLGAKAGLYLDRIREFLFDQPRESNTEGGIFPAIFGTVLMVFLMSFAVVPLGVLAALYLHEYAGGGPLVRLVRIAVNNLAGVPSIVFGVFGLGFFVYLIGGTIDQLFFSERLPTPTYGTGGILWASLTLALLTVPVVIVATEEGLSAVPRAVREGSLALGATRFETIWRVVLPASLPGILTGVILAVARAAGEVAPLMIVGMVKLADIPIDHHFPFLHFSGKFMHLGFHIYDLGFQSPNVEAVRPLVFATAFLLVFLVILMNLVATWIRNHLQRKYATSAV